MFQKSMFRLGAITALLFTVLISLQCREKPEKQEEIPEPLPVEVALPVSIKELKATVAEIRGDSIDVLPSMTFKAIDSSGYITSIDIQEAGALFENISKGRPPSKVPIAEVELSEELAVMFMGKGYIGPIWAVALIDRQTSSIKGITFSHRMESEGYGAQIATTNFASKFMNTVLVSDEQAFGLKQGGSILIEGEQVIDGISGATNTSEGVIKMLNERAAQLKPYFEKYQSN